MHMCEGVQCSLSFICSKPIVPQASENRRPKCDPITSPHLLSWPVVSDLLSRSKRPIAATRVTLDDSTPQ
jgi:hypothetical protein